MRLWGEYNKHLLWRGLPLARESLFLGGLQAISGLLHCQPEGLEVGQSLLIPTWAGNTPHNPELGIEPNLDYELQNLEGVVRIVNSRGLKDRNRVKRCDDRLKGYIKIKEMVNVEVHDGVS